MIDILVTFNTGFYKKGYLVMKRKEIIKNYLKTWFFLDLLASFPYSWIFKDNVSEDGPIDKGSILYKTP
jgi:hyperpolarization activated cyclic nucleotide-gated potassium channel 2